MYKIDLFLYATQSTNMALSIRIFIILMKLVFWWECCCMQNLLLFWIVKKNFVWSSLVIKNKFQLFKTFVQIVGQFFCTLLLKINVIFFWYINSKFFDTWRIHSSENDWITNEINLDWLHHFQNCIKSCMTNKCQFLILNGHNSHCFIEFNNYCKKMDIIVFCIFFHLFYIFQSFDVKCFGSLKIVYKKKIKKIIWMHFMHIIKNNFFLVFKQVFFASMNEKNVQVKF